MTSSLDWLFSHPIILMSSLICCSFSLLNLKWHPLVHSLWWQLTMLFKVPSSQLSILKCYTIGKSTIVPSIFTAKNREHSLLILNSTNFPTNSMISMMLVTSGSLQSTLLHYCLHLLWQLELVLLKPPLSFIRCMQKLFSLPCLCSLMMKLMSHETS